MITKTIVTSTMILRAIAIDAYLLIAVVPIVLAQHDVVWQTLIQVGIGAVVTIVLAWMNKRTNAIVVETAANQDKKIALIATNQDKKIEQVSEMVEVVHKATNSLVTQLVSKTEQEALARGGAEEKSRAEAVKQSP